MKFPNRIFIVLLALQSLVLWAAYQRTLSPAFPPNDSPETVAAAWELGIQHPPGYPLYTLLGRVMSANLPLGSPAWRVNCLSSSLAVLGCLALSLFLARLLRFLMPRLASLAAWSAALGGGAWLGLSRIFWQQATEAKGGIYLLNALITVLLLRLGLELLLANRPERARPTLLLGCLLAGLGLANHYPSLGVCLPFLLLPVFLAWRRGLVAPALWPAGLGAVLAACSVYFMLPMRAGYAPVVNLGNPVDWDNFWYVVLRSGYSQKQWADAPGLLQAQLAQWWGFLWNEGGALMPLAAALGVFNLARGAWPGAGEADRNKTLINRGMLAGLGGIYLGIFLAVVVYNRNEPSTVWLMEVFLIPGQICLAALAGLGLAKILGLAPALAPLAPALLLALLWSTHLQYENRRGDYFYWDFGNDILFSLPQDAVYLPEGDFYYMPLYYNKGVENRRADVALLHKNMLATYPGLKELARQKKGLKVDLTPGLTVLQCLLRDNLAAFPFCVGTFHTSITLQDLGGGRLSQRGVVQQVLPALAPDPPMSLGLATGPRFDGIPILKRDLFVKNMVRWYRDSYLAQLRDLGGLDEPGAKSAAIPKDKAEAIRRYRLLAREVSSQMESGQ